MMTLRRLCSTFAALALCAALWACGPPKTRLQALPAQASVLAFGDSVTCGTGAAAGQDWPTLLAASTRWRIHNAGLAGDTAEQARARLPALLAQYQPQLVIVELGGNDFLQRKPASEVKEHLRSIVREARASGAQVVLIAVPELSVMSVVMKKPQDAPLYLELAQEEKLPLIDDVFSTVLRDPALRADPVHPNAAGYRHMARALHSALQDLGGLP